MRLFFFYLFLFVNLFGYGQKSTPFAKLTYDKVVMYDFEGGKGTDLYVINADGQLAKNVKKQAQLTLTENNTLSKKINSKKSYGAATASCFDPHLGFVYYYNGKVVAHVTVCLDCNRMRSSIDIPEQKQGKTGSGKNVYYIADGLSDTFRNYLNSLMKKYNFSHQIK